MSSSIQDWQQSEMVLTKVKKKSVRHEHTPKYYREREPEIMQLLMLAAMSVATRTGITMVVTALDQMGD